MVVRDVALSGVPLAYRLRRRFVSGVPEHRWARVAPQQHRSLEEPRVLHPTGGVDVPPCAHRRWWVVVREVHGVDQRRGRARTAGVLSARLEQRRPVAVEQVCRFLRVASPTHTWVLLKGI